MTNTKKIGAVDRDLAAWLGDAPGQPGADPALRALDALLAAGPSPAATRAAQAGLRRARDGQPPMGLWYDWTTSRFGRVYFAATAEGLVAVDFGIKESDFQARVRARHGRAAVRSPERVARFGRQLADYLAGKRTRFDLPLDLSRAPAFQQQVLLAALLIPRGQVVTYGEIARRIGRPRASRAVGQALGHNPIPIVIPCHRVVGSDGALRGYGSGKGVETKAQLLRLEGAR